MQGTIIPVAPSLAEDWEDRSHGLLVPYLAVRALLGVLVPSRCALDVKGVFRPAVRRRKLTGLRFHDYAPHTYGALMVAVRAHPKYLQEQMGHSSIRVTLDLCGHLFPDANRGFS